MAKLSKIDEYIQRYCCKEGCSATEAKEHYIVKEVAKMYEGTEKTQHNEFYAGCGCLDAEDKSC